MKKFAFLLILLMPVFFPYRILAQTDFPLITIPPKTVARNQLQLLESSTPSARLDTLISLSQMDKIFLKRLNTAYERLYKIALRISTRLEKTGKIPNFKYKSSLASLTLSYNEIVQKLSELKKGQKNLQEQLILLEGSEDPKSIYKNTRELMQKQNLNLEEILKNEKDLAASLGKILAQ